MPKLHILSGVLEGKVIDLIEERITVGRALDNMIRLDDGTVSHHHSMLLIENGEIKLRDLNSTNGTRVNAMRVVETKLHNGDQVRMGSVEMRFESDTKKASQPMPPTQTGVDLSQVGAGSTLPPTFSTASPLAANRNPIAIPIVWAVVILVVVALIAIVFFLKGMIGMQ